ncbi:MAG TPA: 2Fe-2S iron-sulfur cluster-binding protein [Crenalkalicoccus sp.]|nr:2Fe-2S iron-sulfur cluster-binding protein [Crenalkalicoccus sp.]
MPRITVQVGAEAHAGEVPDNANLVVRAGIRKFPWPHLKYGCGMGKCGKCASRILAGAESLPEPNWKEHKVLGERLEQGWRLCCQLWLSHDLTLTQEAEAAARPPAEPCPAEPCPTVPCTSS